MNNLFFYVAPLIKIQKLRELSLILRDELFCSTCAEIDITSFHNINSFHE